MTGKLFDPHLDILEQRFQTLRDQIGARPEACRPELEGALQELSQAIAALRADRGAGGSPQPPPTAGREAQAGQAEAMVRLAEAWHFGEPGLAADPAKAVLWSEQAAAAGNAQVQLGCGPQPAVEGQLRRVVARPVVERIAGVIADE